MVGRRHLVPAAALALAALLALPASAGTSHWDLVSDGWARGRGAGVTLGARVDHPRAARVRMEVTPDDTVLFGLVLVRCRSGDGTRGRMRIRSFMRGGDGTRNIGLPFRRPSRCNIGVSLANMFGEGEIAAWLEVR